MATRSPEEIRASIQQNRVELGQSLERLRGEVVRLTDWRSQLREHQQQAVIAAGVAGFVVGGGIAALGGVLGRRKKKQQPENWAQALRMQAAEAIAAFTNR